MPQVSVVLDCSDNFATRHAVNRACVAHRVPLVSGAVIRFDGQVSVFDPRAPDSPCYSCLFPQDQAFTDAACSSMGVFAPLVGVVGALQAAEALKLIMGIGDSLAGRLLLLDGRAMEWTSINSVTQSRLSRLFNQGDVVHAKSSYLPSLRFGRPGLAATQTIRYDIYVENGTRAGEQIVEQDDDGTTSRQVHLQGQRGGTGTERTLQDRPRWHHERVRSQGQPTFGSAVDDHFRLRTVASWKSTTEHGSRGTAPAPCTCR